MLEKNKLKSFRASGCDGKLYRFASFDARKLRGCGELGLEKLRSPPWKWPPVLVGVHVLGEKNMTELAPAVA